MIWNDLLIHFSVDYVYFQIFNNASHILCPQIASPGYAMVNVQCMQHCASLILQYVLFAMVKRFLFN